MTYRGLGHRSTSRSGRRGPSIANLTDAYRPDLGSSLTNRKRVEAAPYKGSASMIVVVPQGIPHRTRGRPATCSAAGEDLGC